MSKSASFKRIRIGVFTLIAGSIAIEAIAADPVAAPVPIPAATAVAPARIATAAAWWQASDNPVFVVEFVGQVAGETGMAIRFSKDIGDPLKASRFLRVIDDAGAIVPGSWQAAAIPQVIVLQGLKPGKYFVIVDPRISDTKGDVLGSLLAGSVVIR